MTEPVLNEKAREAVHAAKNAAQAVELVRQEQLDTAAEGAAQKAATLASEKLADKIVDEKRMGEVVREQMEHVLATGSEQEKTLILARVKYVCQDIKDMKETLEEIGKQMAQRSQDFALLQQQSSLTNKIVFGLISVIVLGFMASLSMVVFR